MKKASRSLPVTVLALVVTLGVAPQAAAVESDYPDYTVEDGEPAFVDECVEADFSVTIDDTVYRPGDVASGFSLSSDYSVAAGEGVTVGWAYATVVQDEYGHGSRPPFSVFAGVSDVSGRSGEWLALNGLYDFAFYPSIFYAECPGTDDLAYIQVFPGLTLNQVGYAATLDEGVYLSDQETLDSTGLGEPNQGSLAFAPMSNFRNPAYAFWAMYLEDLVNENPDVAFEFGDPLEGDFTQGVWAWVGWYVAEGEREGEYTEFASSFYSVSEGSELQETSIEDDLSLPTSLASPSPSRESASGSPGIFLTVAGRVGYLFESSEVVYGAYAVAPNSAYQLSVQSISNPTMAVRVLASGRVNSGGHLEASTALPFLTPGNYKIAFTGTASNGVPLKLVNHVTVDGSGKFTSISSERLQPLLP